MSDIDPMTGHSLTPSPVVERVHSPRGVFESGIQLSQDGSTGDNVEDEHFQRIAALSQMTKFATGDLSKDIPNYLTIKKISRLMVGLLGDDE